MQTFLILGAGTGGTMVANKMAELLDPQEWRILIVDREETHYYQPGFLFIPFGIYTPADVVNPSETSFRPKLRSSSPTSNRSNFGTEPRAPGKKEDNQLRLPGHCHRQ